MRRLAAPTALLAVVGLALGVVRVSGVSSSTLAYIALATVLVALVIAIGGLWVRRTESVLTIVLVLLFLVPQNYVLVGPLRSVGNPALLGGLFTLVLWSSGRLLALVTPYRDHPARWLVMMYLLTACAAWTAGMMRPLAQSESAGAARALFPVAAGVGLAMFACDGLARRQQVETLLQRLVYIGGVAALIGVVEFLVPGFNYRTVAHLPGLTANTDDVVSDSRSGFDRVMGAAAHPIEYSVALAAIVPLALHFGLHGRTPSIRRLSLGSLLALMLVTPMTVSRSGVVCIAVGLAVYLAHLSGRARLNAAVLGIIGLGFMRAAIPGLLGTLRSLFLVGEKDPSIANRTADYAKIPALMDGHLWFGRGLGTFRPDQYFFLDNQYLGSMLEGGVVGVGALVALFVVGMGLARGARHRSRARDVRGLGQALAGSIAVLAAGAATFDELSFRQTSLLLLLLVGCAGALWAAVRREAEDESRPPQLPSSTATIPRQELRTHA